MLFRITDIKGSHGKIFLSSYYVSCCQVEWCQYSFLHIVWHEMLMNYLLSFDVGQYTTDAFWRETTRNFGRLLIVVWRLILTITYFNSDHGCYFKFINCMKEVIHNKWKMVRRMAYYILIYMNIIGCALLPNRYTAKF